MHWGVRGIIASICESGWRAEQGENKKSYIQRFAGSYTLGREVVITVMVGELV